MRVKARNERHKMNLCKQSGVCGLDSFKGQHKRASKFVLFCCCCCHFGIYSRRDWGQLKKKKPGCCSKVEMARHGKRCGSHSQVFILVWLRATKMARCNKMEMVQNPVMSRSKARQQEMLLGIGFFWGGLLDFIQDWGQIRNRALPPSGDCGPKACNIQS